MSESNVEEVDPSDLPNPALNQDLYANQDLLWWEIRENEDNRWIDQHFTEDINLDQRNGLIDETAEPPSDLIMPLLRYQKEFLAWALKQEQSVGGGILADEMGMGKTIQAISLVLAKREFDRAQFGDRTMGWTLVVCPPVAVTQWVSEIARFTSPGSTKVLVYHGAKGEKNVKEFRKYDFVLTTYSTVESEFRRNRMQIIAKSKSSVKGKEADIGEDSKMKPRLHSVKWNRIILDEAHYIKKSRNNLAKSLFTLEATYRWALSGTLLENTVGEFYSLIRFLQIIPYSYNFCQDCDFKFLDYGFGSDYSEHENCPHLQHFSWWTKYIKNPINLSGISRKGMRKQAMITFSENSDGDGEHMNIITFPGNSQWIEETMITLSENSVWENRNTITYPRNSEWGRIREREKRVRAMILFKVMKDILIRRTKLGRAADLNLPPRIIILRRDTLDVTEANYQSLHTQSCVEFNNYIQNKSLKAIYRNLLDLLTRLRQAANYPYLLEHQGFRASTKIKALLEEIRFMIERDGSAKGLVFSHFASFLDLINYSLGKSGVGCVKLEESMSTADRDDIINKFKKDPNCRILLMSLKAGGIAFTLNLTVASHVFMMDPWWNSAVESQAEGIIHTIGQHKEIRIVRFLLENTIEERILELREALKFSRLTEGKLRLCDFRFLFENIPLEAE